MAASNKARTVLKILIGLGVVALGVMSSIAFLPELKEVALGVLGPALVLVGLVMIAVAKE